MKWAILTLCLTLTGCDFAPKVELSTASWVCSKVASVDRVDLIPAGKAAVPVPSSNLECVQWSRMGVQP